MTRPELTKKIKTYSEAKQEYLDMRAAVRESLKFVNDLIGQLPDEHDTEARLDELGSSVPKSFLEDVKLDGDKKYDVNLFVARLSRTPMRY